MTAATATTLSMSAPMPSARASGAANTQPAAVSAKTSTVTRRPRVHTSGSQAEATRPPSRGRRTRYSTPIISGSSSATAGTPMRSHCANEMPAAAAAMALGGLPTSVPMPPMLAA